MTTKTQAIDNNGKTINVVFRPSTTTVLATGSVSPAYANGDIIRVVCDATSHIIVGNTAAGTASATDVYMGTARPEYFKMEGGYLYVAGVGGNTYVTLMV